MSSKIVTLKVNGEDITLSFFVQSFFNHVLNGMIAALDKTCTVETLQLTGSKEETKLTVNTVLVSMNEFVTNAVRKTSEGMISSLRGIQDISTFEIEVSTAK